MTVTTTTTTWQPTSPLLTSHDIPFGLPWKYVPLLLLLEHLQFLLDVWATLIRYCGWSKLEPCLSLICRGARGIKPSYQLQFIPVSRMPWECHGYYNRVLAKSLIQWALFGVKLGACLTSNLKSLVQLGYAFCALLVASLFTLDDPKTIRPQYRSDELESLLGGVGRCDCTDMSVIGWVLSVIAACAQCFHKLMHTKLRLQVGWFLFAFYILMSFAFYGLAWSGASTFDTGYISSKSMTADVGLNGNAGGLVEYKDLVMLPHGCQKISHPRLVQWDSYYFIDPRVSFQARTDALWVEVTDPNPGSSYDAMIVFNFLCERPAERLLVLQTVKLRITVTKPASPHTRAPRSLQITDNGNMFAFQYAQEIYSLSQGLLVFTFCSVVFVLSTASSLDLCPRSSFHSYIPVRRSDSDEPDDAEL